MFHTKLLSDELNECIATVSCFTAAEGMLGHHKVNPTKHDPINIRLAATVIAVVILKNGETFLGHTTHRGNTAFDFTVASNKSKDKAFRKVKEHITKHHINALL